MQINISCLCLFAFIRTVFKHYDRVNRFQILVDEGTAFQAFHSCILTQHEIGGVAGHTFTRKSVWNFLDLDICDRAIFQLDKDIQKQERGGRQHAVFI